MNLVNQTIKKFLIVVGYNKDKVIGLDYKGGGLAGAFENRETGEHDSVSLYDFLFNKNYYIVLEWF